MVITKVWVLHKTQLFFSDDEKMDISRKFDKIEQAMDQIQEIVNEFLNDLHYRWTVGVSILSDL